MATKTYSNPDLVGRLAALGIHVTPGQPAANPSVQAKRTADFRAGVTYTPSGSGSVRALPPGQRAAPGPALPPLQPGQSRTGPMQQLPPSRQPQGNAPQFFNGFGAAGPMSSYRAPTYQGPGSSGVPMGAYGAQQPYRPPAYSPDVIGPLRSFDQQNPWRPQQPSSQMGPSEKPTWMSTSLWALYAMDRLGSK